MAETAAEPWVDHVLRKYDGPGSAPGCRQAPRRPFVSEDAFSGSLFWRLDLPGGGDRPTWPSLDDAEASPTLSSWLLRCWPAEHPSAERLTWQHRVLEHAWRRGFRRLPLPARSLEDHTWTAAGGRRWELVPWLAGEAVPARDCTAPRLSSGLTLLANFHRATEDFGVTLSDALHSGDRGPRAVPPAWIERRQRLEALRQGGWRRLRDRLMQAPPSLVEPGAAVLDLVERALPGVVHELNRRPPPALSLQPCVRDVWSAHVLFAGDEAVGLIDFGAMRPDHVACDVARLLASWCGDDVDLWQAGLSAYGEVRPLSEAELLLVRQLDRCAVLLTGVQWLEWVLLEGRRFRPGVVEQRLQAAYERLLRLTF